MNKKLKILIFIALFSAFSTLVYAYFRYPIFVSFYKIDISESIVMLGSLVLGPIPGIAIQILKNLLKIIVSGSNSAGIGDLADFISGLLYIFPATVLYNKKSKKKNLIFSLTIGSMLSIIVSCLFNYYVLLPTFATEETIVAIGHTINSNITSFWSFIIYITAPFNLIKCVVNSLIIVLCEKRLKMIFNKKILK